MQSRDGLTETLLHMLAQLPDLQVAARTSSFAFKNKEEDIKSIGQKLNVNNVLEGSVQKQQDQIRISVRLTDASNGYTLFSESYTDAVENIFDLQGRIATDIAEKIALALDVFTLWRQPEIPLQIEQFRLALDQGDLLTRGEPHQAERHAIPVLFRGIVHDGPTLQERFCLGLSG